jgi:SAM-dependent methyltransferase
MKTPDSQWYKEIWNLDIQNLSWVENTKLEVDFLIDVMQLSGTEKILDLACGYGRHSIELAKRGFSVVGIDITSDYINEAKRLSLIDNLNIDFICSDLRDISYKNEFDVVLNIADGAIGYLEDDLENIKIFDLISSSLKNGGKHFMTICNADHAEKYFPKRHWDIGNKTVSLLEFHWDRKTRRMLYGRWNIIFGEPAVKPESLDAHLSIRLYSFIEITNILKDRNMKIIKTFGNFHKDITISNRNIEMLLYSQKIG